MPDKSWKAYERRIAKVFPGATRRGAHTGDGRNGKSDLILDGYSVECKLLSRPSFSTMLEAANQAERNAESPGDIPLAIVKRKGDLDINALVVMRLETFKEFFVNCPEEIQAEPE
jgi:hypothetical protein